MRTCTPCVEWGAPGTSCSPKGTNTDQPQGIVTIAKAGVTAAAANAVTYSELLELEYSVNRAYRKNREGGVGGFTGRAAGMSGFMFSDSFEKLARSLVDSDGRPMWTPGITAGTCGITDGLPPRLLGYPYVVNDNMDAVATGKVPCLFGNLGYYGIRTVSSVEIFRFWDSRTAQANSIETCCSASRRPTNSAGSATCSLSCCA